MKKKILAVTLSLMVGLVGLTACGEKAPETNTPDAPAVENTQDTVETETPDAEASEDENVEADDTTDAADDTTDETTDDVADGDTTEESTGDKTVAYTLLDQFKTEIAASDDVVTVAEALCENPVFSEVMVGAMEVEEGYLNGFNSEISGFNKGAMFAPFIGTIPFVGYVFETDDAEALKATLESEAALNWNICTTADEMVVETEGNYVFFVMSPLTFEE